MNLIATEKETARLIVLVHRQVIPAPLLALLLARQAQALVLRLM